MVRQAALLLSAHIPGEQIHHDTLPAEQPLVTRLTELDPVADLRQSSLFAKFARPGSLPDMLA
jgi:hypothetical protein